MNWVDGTLIGALVGTLVTIVLGLTTLRFNYKNLYASTVSNSRNNWINIFRDEISQFLALSDMLRYETFDHDNYLNMLKEYHISKNKIIMRLNLNEKRHQEVYLLINKIAYENVIGDEYKVVKEALMEVTRDLLKDEWERVKLEAGGKKNGRR